MSLPQIWYMLCCLAFAIYVLLDGFDLGAGAISLWLARDRAERDAIVQAIGPVWDGNEVWLVAGAATLLMAFPTALGIALSGFYLPMMFVLWLLMLRALGIEMQHLSHHLLWLQAWECVFAGSSLALIGVLGLAIGNVLRGFDLTQEGGLFMPLWTHLQPHAPLGIIDWYTVPVAGFAVVLLVSHGLYWIADRCGGALAERALTWAGRGTWLTLPCFAVVTIVSATMPFGLALRESQAAFALLFPISFVGAAWLALHAARRRRTRLAFGGSCGQVITALAAAVFRAYPELLPGLVPGTGLALDRAAAADVALASALWWWLPGIAVVVMYFVWNYRMLRKVNVVDASAH